MTIATSLVTLFGIIFLVLGVAASYLRRTSAITSGPILQETTGIASGVLILLWVTVIRVLNIVLPAELLHSAGGVFLLAVAINATAAYTGFKLARRYHPDWLGTTTTEPVREAPAEPAAD